MTAPPGVFRWSLSDAPEGERLAMFRDVYGPTLNMDFAPLSEDLELEGEHLALPGVSVLHARNSPMRARRKDFSRENDDLLLVWTAIAGQGRMTHCGREIGGRDGTAVLVNCLDPFSAEMLSEFRPVNVRIPRAMLLPLVPHPDDVLMRPVPADAPSFRLLCAYLDVLRREGPPAAPELAAAVAAHICELVALSVGATRDGEAQAAAHGVPAARLAAIKRWVLDRLGDLGLSVTGAARNQKVSPRYVQMLFETEGTTFSAFVLNARLALAHRRLASRAARHLPISAIAFDAGFGDLSYFNRAFRAAFGATPTDVRRQAGSPASPCDKAGFAPVQDRIGARAIDGALQQGRSETP